MTSRVLRAVVAMTATLALLAAPTLAAAESTPYAALVVDADTGTVLHAVDAARAWYPASLTKLMTVYLTLAAVQSRRLGIEDRLEVSPHAADQPETALGLRAGEHLTVEQAVLAVLTRSANDAAVVLAERVGGSEDRFAALMTETARDLGMTGTVFRNASGLPDPAQVTTAHDMALLARSLQRRFPEHYHYFGTRSFRWHGAVLGNINGFLAAYAGADGLKTGFTCGSGYNLVASARRHGRRLIGVLLGAGSGADRTQAMTRLLDAGFASTASGPALAALATPALAPPPFRLDGGSCTIGAGRRPGALPGWGLLLGVFDSEDKAHTYLARARSPLKPLAPNGRPVVQRQENVEVPRFRALMVGLGQLQAIRSCLALRALGSICVVQSPQRLNQTAVPDRS